jgi:hypothetical protein
MLPAALTLQVAHPAVGAGVDEHSVFRTDPWGRGERSLRSLQLWVYGGDAAAEEGRRLRELHKTIQGTDAHGRRYHALDPAYYSWVHATGFPVYQHALRYLARPLTGAQERKLYAEWLQVGRVLGIHDRDMPQTIEEFWPYYRKVLADELEATVVVRELIATDPAMPPPDRAAAGREILHRGDAGHGLDDDVRHESTDGLGEVGERGVHVGVADGREGDGAAVAQQRGDGLAGGVPGGLAPGSVAALVEREDDPYDLVGVDVVQDGRLGASRLAAVFSVGRGHHGHDDDIGLLKGAYALHGHQLRVTGPHSDPDQPSHRVHLSTNRRAVPGSEAQCVCR